MLLLISSVLPTMPGSALEVAPPQTVADHDDRMAARRDLVRRQERAAEPGANAENLEVVSGDDLAPDLAGAAASAQVGRGQDGAEELRERSIVIAEVLVVGIGDAERTSGARFGEDDGEAARLRHAGERAERHAFEHREDGGVQADAEREHADHGEREGRVLRERADRVADVAHQVPQRLEPSRGPHAAGRFGRPRDVAELLQRRIVRVRSICAIRDLLLRGDRQVRADFFLEIVFVELARTVRRPGNICNDLRFLSPTGRRPFSQDRIPMVIPQ